MAFKIVTRNAAGQVTFDATVRTLREQTVQVIAGNNSGGTVTHPAGTTIQFIANNSGYGINMFKGADSGEYLDTMSQTVAVTVATS